MKKMTVDEIEAALNNELINIRLNYEHKLRVLEWKSAAIKISLISIFLVIAIFFNVNNLPPVFVYLFEFFAIGQTMLLMDEA